MRGLGGADVSLCVAHDELDLALYVVGEFHDLSQLRLRREMIETGYQGHDAGRVSRADVLDVPDQLSGYLFLVHVVGELHVLLVGEVLGVVGHIPRLQGQHVRPVEHIEGTAIAVAEMADEHARAVQTRVHELIRVPAGDLRHAPHEQQAVYAEVVQDLGKLQGMPEIVGQVPGFHDGALVSCTTDCRTGNCEPWIPR